MPKEAVFTIKLEADLRDAFMAEAQAVDRPASQIVREMMRDFVRRQREERSYDHFLLEKVSIARAQKRAGQGIPADEIEAEFAERRAELLRRAAKDNA